MRLIDYTIVIVCSIIRLLFNFLIFQDLRNSGSIKKKLLKENNWFFIFTFLFYENKIVGTLGTIKKMFLRKFCFLLIVFFFLLNKGNFKMISIVNVCTFQVVRDAREYKHFLPGDLICFCYFFFFFEKLGDFKNGFTYYFCDSRELIFLRTFFFTS